MSNSWDKNSLWIKWSNLKAHMCQLRTVRVARVGLDGQDPLGEMSMKEEGRNIRVDSLYNTHCMSEPCTRWENGVSGRRMLNTLQIRESFSQADQESSEKSFLREDSCNRWEEQAFTNLPATVSPWLLVKLWPLGKIWDTPKCVAGGPPSTTTVNCLERDSRGMSHTTSLSKIFI